MSYLQIPLQQTANQTFSVTLDGAVAQITLRTTDFGLFADVVYAGVSIVQGRACLDRTDLNPSRYRGLPQALFFADLQGSTDPTYDSFNTRYVLMYGDPNT